MSIRRKKETITIQQLKVYICNDCDEIARYVIKDGNTIIYNLCGYHTNLFRERMRKSNTDIKEV